MSSQFEEDLNAAKSAIEQLFSSKLSLEFDHVVDEGEYDGEAIIDDIEDEDDSNIVDELQVFYAPKIIGTGIPFFKGKKGLEEDLGLKLNKIENFGNDVRLTFYRY